MNYRHAYHAGNFADVWKHALLVYCIEHLKKKETPFRVVDTHAGAGLYRLTADEAQRTGEWRDGIGRLREADLRHAPTAVRRLLDLVDAENRSGPHTYPGSPVLAAALLRAQDMLIANELQPDVARQLARVLKGRCPHKVTNIDGYTTLKAALPPPERRGLVLIDPPFEEPGELVRMTEGLAEALKRFPRGHYLLWYPIKDDKPVQRFHKGVTAVAAEAGVETVLAIDLLLRPPRHPDLLNGCGVVVVNAPYGSLDDLPVIAEWVARALDTQDRQTRTSPSTRILHLRSSAGPATRG